MAAIDRTDRLEERIDTVDEKVQKIDHRLSLLEGKVIAASAVGASIGSLVIGVFLLIAQFLLGRGGN
jgi:tetrahydromethanopterin S-methyltransferase subunit G